MNRPNILAAAFALVTLAACGGSSDKKTPPPPPPPVSLDDVPGRLARDRPRRPRDRRSRHARRRRLTLDAPSGRPLGRDRPLVPDTDHQPRPRLFTGIPTVERRGRRLRVGQSGATDGTTSVDADVALAAVGEHARRTARAGAGGRRHRQQPRPRLRGVPERLPAVTPTAVVGQPTSPRSTPACTGATARPAAERRHHRGRPGSSWPTRATIACSSGTPFPRPTGPRRIASSVRPTSRSCAVNRDRRSADADHDSPTPPTCGATAPRVAVSDSGNNRVLALEQLPPRAAPTRRVVGQSSFAGRGGLDWQ